MLADKNICTGCGACAASCLLNCIEMQSDQEGFRYPQIDTARCVSCHKCEAVCPVLNKIAAQERPRAYGVQHKDNRHRSTSSSGGVFPALATFVLEKGGAVCGAGYTDNFEVEHQIIENASDICKLQGAKYAQSRVEHLFPEIKELLNRGIPVLFVGTPCQTMGLRAYLGRDYQELLLVDMICHGVPSPKVWQRYLRGRSQVDAPGSELCAVNLRSKATGWSHYSYSVDMEYADGTKYSVPQGQDMFMRGFVSNLYLRPSCSECTFKGVQRCSDLTLGDYWGIWDQHPEFDDNKGTSLLLIHTEKGRGAWVRISEQFRSLDVTVQEATAQNPSAVCASIPHPNREKFFRRMESEKNLQHWIKHCLEPRKEKFLQRLIRKVSRN